MEETGNGEEQVSQVTVKPKHDEPKCPFCHDTDFSVAVALRCLDCMAWQHKQCFDEAGVRCGACHAELTSQVALTPGQIPTDMTDTERKHYELTGSLEMYFLGKRADRAARERTRRMLEEAEKKQLELHMRVVSEQDGLVPKTPDFLTRGPSECPQLESNKRGDEQKHASDAVTHELIKENITIDALRESNRQVAAANETLRRETEDALHRTAHQLIQEQRASESRTRELVVRVVYMVAIVITLIVTLPHLLTVMFGSDR